MCPPWVSSTIVEICAGKPATPIIAINGQKPPPRSGKPKLSASQIIRAVLPMKVAKPAGTKPIASGLTIVLLLKARSTPKPCHAATARDRTKTTMARRRAFWIDEPCHLARGGIASLAIST